ncbi:DUF917 family protein [Aminobacterium sp. MB27-C1]|uniref:S-methyl thiohydantoin desulfurase domain-containing protein n=1 Tax=Aminobacterium sp. MB27-C1 TaxID=3070661 RepID=UPI0027DE6FB1|nr:DUF917 family protein [Aminobacterium sp. MB27-C1]WMI72337.1 DUF917 family protein [Aminobacterium sp. MB27-C1]
MSQTVLKKEHVEAAVLGGAVLGGGGGGAMERGLDLGCLAVQMGRPILIDAEDCCDENILVTCSGVGAPAAKEAFVSPRAYWRTIDLLQTHNKEQIGGLITNECGGNAVVNGWLQAALLDLPIVDIPCNGRAHPTGVMGSMGLQKDKNYVSIQAFAGGNPDNNTYVEGCVSGGLAETSALVRQAAVQARGLVGVARNPVKASFAKMNGAPGGVAMSIKLGRAMLNVKDKGAEKLVSSVVEFLGGEIITRGTVQNLELETAGGFDVGRVDIDDIALTFWNEYMTLERTNGERLGTFPDLIMTMDGHSGMPVTSAEIEKGQSIYVITVPKTNLCLGEGMRCIDLLRDAERIIHKDISSYQ